MLPKLVVIHPARAFKLAVNPRGEIVLAFGFDWHIHKMTPRERSDKQMMLRANRYRERSLPRSTPNRDELLHHIVQIPAPILHPKRIVQLFVERVEFAIDGVG